MSDNPPRHRPGLPLLAAIGAGVVSGVLLGAFLAQRRSAPAESGLTESVDDLKQRAEKILSELSKSAVLPGAR